MENPFEKFDNQLDEIRTLILDLKKKSEQQQPSIKRYSVDELAENTPIGKQTIWNAIKDGRIKAQRFGRKYLITPEEFNRVCEDVKSLKYKRTA